MAESVFDTFDFTPVNGNPFKQGTPSPVVSEFQKGQPDPNADKLAAASSIPTDATVAPSTLVGKAGANIVKLLAGLAKPKQSLPEYAGDPSHPMPYRLGAAGVEEVNRALSAVPNALQEFMGPMYGEGHVPIFGDLSPEGRQSSYAGAGLTLAAGMGAPGGEEALGAGWNTGAAKYLDSLVKSKPALKPETMSAVKKLIANGPDYGLDFFQKSPENEPGKGFAALATTKHLVEEAAKPKPPPVVTPGAQAASEAAAANAPATATSWTATPPAGLTGHMADIWSTLSPEVQAKIAATPGINVAPPAPPATGAMPTWLPPKAAAAWPTLSPAAQTKLMADLQKINKIGTPVGTVIKGTPKTVTSTPLSPQQAMFGTGGAAESELSPLFQKQWPPLAVPKMFPFDPNATGKAFYAMETAPGTSGQTLPFNPSGLLMNQASVMKRMQDMGFGPLDNNLVWWRGVKPKGPYSWDSAGVGYRDPATKDFEPGIFFHPDTNAYGKPGAPNAKLYGDVLNPHVLRSENPLVMEWKSAAKGDTYYSQDVMSKIIKDAWKKGHDSLLLKNIKDVGGNHDQLIVKHPSQLRHPDAAFDPKYKGSSNLLAARGTGVPPMVVPDKEEGGDNE